jgi:hypothetical protein
VGDRAARHAGGAPAARQSPSWRETNPLKVILGQLRQEAETAAAERRKAR